MQRWKFAVGAVVLTLAVGPVAGRSKGSSAKQTATQAKGKTDPKAANAAKPAEKSAQAPANARNGSAETKSPTPAKKAEAKPPQTAAATKPTQPSKAPAPAAPGAAAKAASSPAPAKPAAAPAPAPAPATTANASFGETQQELQANKALVAAIQPRFSAGTDVVKASLGFRNVQQFVAAVHAAQNLGIPFDKLRSAMVDEKKSLSQAIRTLKPTASATIEAQRADYDARGTIYQTKQSTATAAAAESAAKKPAKASTKPKASSN